MTQAHFANLIDVVSEARRLLSLDGNDFFWSSWPDRDGALQEMDEIIGHLNDGSIPDGLSVLFAPTGALQDTSISSGWDEEFIALARRFDAALTRAKRTTP
jgi:hypothetical protein